MILDTRYFFRQHPLLFILCFSLVLILSACSSSTQQQADHPSEQQSQQQIDRPNEQSVQQTVDTPDEQQVNHQDPTSIDEGWLYGDAYSLIIFLRINPEIQIFVDHQDIVADLIPLNDDGIQVYSTSQVVGMPYADAMTVLIEQIHLHGYLEKADNIDIQIFFHEASEQTMEQCNIAVANAISEYTASHGMAHISFSGGYESLTIVEHDPNKTPTQSSNHDAPTQNENLLEMETDSAGNLTYTKNSLPGGGYCENYYHVDGTYSKQILHESNGEVSTFFYDDNGIRTQELIQTPEGITSTRWLANGERFIKEVISIPNGTTITISYDEHENRTEEHTECPDGSQQTVWFDPNGMSLRMESIHPSGSFQQITYHPNGKHAAVYEQDPEGNWFQQTYSEDGLTSHIVYSDGKEEHLTLHTGGQIAIRTYVTSDGSLEEHFDENGNLMLSISINANGRKAETRFNADRSGSVTQYGSDGSSSTVYFRPDGKVTHGYDSNGNYYEETGNVYAGTKNGGKG